MVGNNEMKQLVLGLFLIVALACVAIPVLAVDVTITATPNYTGVPIVTCSPALNITGLSAVLVGNITHTGGDNATMRGFDWGYSTGNYTSSWNETGNFSIGVFYHGITGLTPGVEVFWKAFAVNIYGQGNSTECDFVAGSGLPLAPTNLTITQTGTGSINLTWTMGVGADTTTIRGKDDGYPTNMTDGYLVYSGNGTWVEVADLDLSSYQYGYRAWSYNSYGYSLDYAQTTIGGSSIMMTLTLALGLMSLILMVFGFLYKPASIMLLLIAGVGWIVTGALMYNSSIIGSANTPVATLLMMLALLCFVWTFVAVMKLRRGRLGSYEKDYQNYEDKVRHITRR